MNKRIVVVSLLGLALGVWRLPMASAAEEQEHKEGQASIANTVGGIWRDVKAHEEKLGQLIAAKQLENVHEVAFEIRDLVNALPARSTELAAEKLAKLKADAKFVADLADRLDKSGDAKDQAGTEASYKKLQGVLRTIESLYSPATLTTGATSAPPAVGYTCPMHTDVKTDAAGACPKCGMRLVPAKT